MMLLIENGEVFAPEHRGVCSLLCSSMIAQVLPQGLLLPQGLKFEVVNAKGCYVVPGFVDPHANLVGAGAEQGFTARTPEITSDELINAGITTVVGTLGCDIVGCNLLNLLTKTMQLYEAGLTALMYTGPFEVPPPSIT